MDILWFFYVPLLLFSVQTGHSQRHQQGLSCVNDFVNNVSCTWNSSALGPGVDCWISGAKKTWMMKKGGKDGTLLIRRCKLKQLQNSPPGCSFVFENKRFTSAEVMPSIRIECNGMLVENLTNYKPCHHIKMHAPSAPNVSSSINGTLILLSPGSPRSSFFKSFDFQVQIKENHRTWNEATTLHTHKQELTIPSWQMKGHSQVRVKIRPPENLYPEASWSNWSPAASWHPALEDKDQTSWLLLGLMLSSALFIAVLLGLYRSFSSRVLLIEKHVPNPSKYFHTLHSVQGGNLKKWLNPQSASGSFFAIQPVDHISKVEVCKGWDMVPSTSSSSGSTTALLHSHSSGPGGGTNTSGVGDHSFSSSCFSKTGYLMSSYSSGSVRADPSPAHFTYQNDFKLQHNGHNLHFSLFSPLHSSGNYELLKKEPHSPDSGFGGAAEEDDNTVEDNDVDVQEESPPLIFYLHDPSHMCPVSLLPPLPHPPSLTQIHCDSQQMADPVAAPGCSYTAWPVAGAMCRSSSMPVESCKTGYLTLKELQTTFSNKSI
ncbi:interleukin-2 receptor subunit beta isoform X2 [Thalassophryne amazonica]|uniref:interleukin-2 receptor subunit beta isoform X2 n=1 Tax=Thalassophryne amazonica TaxID=390379 RepID=UPI001471D1B5|nr:interleukin-2 receptor subunit beta isoform X2 [Thalassophryne amazonica]